MENLKRVIDGDNFRVLEQFKEEETEAVLQKYKNLDKWEEVLPDHDGDIILFKEASE